MFKLSYAAGTLLACLIVGGMSEQAASQHLNVVLSTTYERNPKIEAERANVRALDEDVARANSGYRPVVTADADMGLERERDRPRTFGTSGDTRPAGYGVSVAQPIFSGFRTFYAVREANASVAAGRATLHNVEATILLEAVRAYMEVIRDSALVKLRGENVAYLDRELTSNRRRREEGTLTRTDVSQTLAQRASFYSQLQSAQASLQSSLSVFERVVGELPRGLSQPDVRRLRLPLSLNEAIAVAEKEHPAIAAAAFREQAAALAVARIRGELLPTVQLRGQYTHRYEPSTTLDETETLSVRGTVSVPLYSGGEVEARVRQAKEVQLSRVQQLHQTRLEVRAQMTQAWANWMAVRARLESDELFVKASTDTLDGVRKEERAGQRTVAEVLNAQLALFNAQASLIVTRNDLVIAAYTLLAAAGRLHAKELALRVAIYDPQDNYEATYRRWGGLRIRHGDGREEDVHVPMPLR